MVEIDTETLNSLRYITGRISSIEADVRSLARQSGAAFQSVESGDGSVLIYDDDGNVIGSIGSGGIGLDSTILGPPQPEPPDVDGILNALVISWDGTFTDGDWTENLVDHVEIHAVANSGDLLSDTTQVGTFVSSNGGVFTYPWNALDGGRWIYLVAVTTAGEEGIPSNGVLGIPDATAPTDGNPPTVAPVVTVRGGIQNVLATYEPIVNPDPVIYRVYVKDGSAPSLVGTTDLLLTTPQTAVTINRLPSGTAVTQAMTIHVRVVAFDGDGDGPPSVDASATPVQIGTIDITPLSITSTEIAPDSITSAKIAANTIVANDIAALTITAAQIAANTVTAGQIAANTITAGQIAASTITSAEIAANTITAANIAANTITGAQIAAGTITATEIAANSITAAKLSATAIDGITITGATLQSAATGPRFIAHDLGGNQFALDFFTGTAGEDPSRIVQDLAGEGLVFYSGRVGPETAFSMALIPDWGLQVDGLQIGGLGDLIDVMKWDVRSVTTNASGDFTFTHGAGTTPIAVHAWSQGAAFVSFRTISLGATTVTMRAWDVNGGAIKASATFDIGYLILA